jgi:hypothetical protein
MKQCPACNETFEDNDAFCDLDGVALIDPTDALRDSLTTYATPLQGSSSAWVTGTIGGFIGILISVLLYALFLMPGNRRDLDTKQSRASQSRGMTDPRSNRVAVAPTPLTVAPAPSPSSEDVAATASPNPTQTPAVPPSASTATAALNRGPIATGSRQSTEGDRAIIRMTDGSSVEADAAWEDSQGVWYRRSGLVSFVERDRVDTITGVSPRGSDSPATPKQKTDQR